MRTDRERVEQLATHLVNVQADVARLVAGLETLTGIVEQLRQRVEQRGRDIIETVHMVEAFPAAIAGVAQRVVALEGEFAKHLEDHEHAAGDWENDPQAPGGDHPDCNGRSHPG